MEVLETNYRLKTAPPKYLRTTMVDKETPTIGRIIHMLYRRSPAMPPDYHKCRPAIVTGVDNNELFLTIFAPNLAPQSAVCPIDSKDWHWPERD